MDSVKIKRYEDSSYIILSNGTVARVMKETKVFNQSYYNLIINKKQKRINKTELMKMFEHKDAGV